MSSVRVWVTGRRSTPARTLPHLPPRDDSRILDSSTLLPDPGLGKAGAGAPGGLCVGSHGAHSPGGNRHLPGSPFARSEGTGREPGPSTDMFGELQVAFSSVSIRGVLKAKSPSKSPAGAALPTYCHNRRSIDLTCHLATRSGVPGSQQQDP